MKMKWKLLWALAAGAFLALGPGVGRAEAWRGPEVQQPDTIQGQVTDREGNPLNGAEVVLVELGRKAVTAQDGTFRFADVPHGRYTLSVRLPGYAPVVRQIEVAERTASLRVELREAPFQMDAITVSATRSPVEALMSPLPVTAVGGEWLQRAQGESLGEALEGVAGVRNLSTGAQIGKPVIRGLTGARVLVMDNGLRVEDYSWGDEHGSAVEPRLAERVEVIRGPASVLYGSDALGGVVNVIPEGLPEAPDGGTLIRGGLETYGASNNGELGGALRLEGARGSIGWRAGLVGRWSGDLRTPEGRLENTGAGVLNGEAAVGLRGTWGNGVLRYSRFNSEFELLEGMMEEGEGEPHEEGHGSPVQKLVDDRVQFTGNFPLRGLRFETRAQWERSQRREFEGADEGEAAVDLVLNTLSLDLLGHHALGERVRGTVGLSTLRQVNETRGEEPLVPGAEVVSAALFAFEQATLGRWAISAGARVDLRWLDVEENEGLGVVAQTRDYTALSGNLGVVYRPTEGLALVANVGRGFRAPSLFELFTSGVHHGQARYEIGRADLGPEKSLNVDLGLRWERERFRGELAAYRNLIDDYIYIAPTGEFREGFRVFRYDRARAVLWGGEASVEWRPWHLLTLRGRYDYTRGTNVDTDEPLPLVPPARADLGAEVHLDELAWADRVYMGAETELVAEQKRRSAFDVATGGYGLLHLRAGVERRVAGRPVRVDLTVRNALDKAYRDYLSRYKEFALNPGRNVVLRASVDL
ncbi:MAG TPA: TonB-dependent receptor [Longimicrobiales bacterium]